MLKIILCLQKQNTFMQDGKVDLELTNLNLEITETFLKNLKIIFYLKKNKFSKL